MGWHTSGQRGHAVWRVRRADALCRRRPARPESLAAKRSACADGMVEQSGREARKGWRAQGARRLLGRLLRPPAAALHSRRCTLCAACCTAVEGVACWADHIASGSISITTVSPSIARFIACVRHDPIAAGAHGVRPPARERMPHARVRARLCGVTLRRRRRTATARRAPASRASRATAGFTMRPGMMTSPRTCAFATNPVKGFDRKTCSDPCMPWAAACACAGAQPRVHRSAQRAPRRARGRASQVRTVYYSTLY